MASTSVAFKSTLFQSGKAHPIHRKCVRRDFQKCLALDGTLNTDLATPFIYTGNVVRIDESGLAASGVQRSAKPDLINREIANQH